jgi:hypothetical protein
MRPTAWAKYVLACVLALGLGSLAWTAQENQTKTKGGGSVTVTGCLQKGDEAGEYAITGEDGKRYGLRSKSVDLSKHVGHQVTITGTKMREENEEKEKKEAAWRPARFTRTSWPDPGCGHRRQGVC